MDVLWRSLSVICRMYERGFEVVRPLPINVPGDLDFGGWELWSLVFGFQLFIFTRLIPGTEGSDLSTLEIKLVDRKIGIDLRVHGTYEQLPGDFYEHPPWKGHRTRIICTGEDVPKQNLLNQTRRLLLYRIGNIVFQHWNWSWRSIPFWESMFGTPAFASMS